ncbi:ornithine carbamoyltransferase [Gammaproteobacteria bacterium]|nr:ornithine carbamoyltransferase [Gammaproteobacteria bacterium]|tara:strand:- start:1152 stop:2033 length:882 start_codon:yes stop_codon:yes gene_type:complete
MSKQFLNLNDLSRDKLENIFDISLELKQNSQIGEQLKNKYLGLIFEKPSTRTRVSFEVAMTQLGGKASFLSVNDLQLGRGEPIEDTSKVLSSIVDGLVLRTMDHKTQEEFAQNSTVPIINGLSNMSHPCQLLADLLTFKEEKGEIEGKKVAWCGDFNNVCKSYAEAAKIFNFDLWVCCPKEFMPKNKGLYEHVNFTSSLEEGIKDSAIVTTDVWVSMGDEKESAKRKNEFRNYQVNEKVLDMASSDVIFLHCLPAVRGQEISKNLFNDPRSRVWNQAENRLHAQKGLLLELLK